MVLQQKYYAANFILRSKDPVTLRSIDLWKFRSSKSGKWYIVEVEHFDKFFYGLKFYWKGVAASKERYSLLTNDFEPRTIVLSCINVMLHYFQENDCASFGFVGAHDLFDANLAEAPNKRFRFYRRMMLTLFSGHKFVQVYDCCNSMYLLLNRKMLDSKRISLLEVEAEISRL